MSVLDRAVQEDLEQHRFRTAGNMRSIWSLLTKFASRHGLEVTDETTALRFLKQQETHTRTPQTLGGVLTYLKRIRARLSEAHLSVTRLDAYKQTLVNRGANVSQHQAVPATLDELRWIIRTWTVSKATWIVLASLDADRFTELGRLQPQQILWEPISPYRMGIRWLERSKTGPSDPYNIANFSVLDFPPSLGKIRSYLRLRTCALFPRLLEHTPQDIYDSLKEHRRTSHLSLRSFRRLAGNLGIRVANDQDVDLSKYGTWMHHKNKFVPSASCRYPDQLFDMVDAGKASTIGRGVMQQLCKI